MNTLKTIVNDDDARDFINHVENSARRSDRLTLLDVFSDITGEQPCMWGSSMIGFGQYHYKSERSRQEGDWFLTGFSPRKQNQTLYITIGYDNYTDLLKNLGKHKTSKGCLQIKKLADVDMKVLEKLIKESYLASKQQYQ
jgi:hypothetical protein